MEATKNTFKEEDTVDHPISLYAATKKSNEVIAHIIVIYLVYLVLAWGFLRYMVHGETRWLQ